MIKVLHIYSNLDVAGAQTVIINYFRFLAGDSDIEMSLLINGTPHNSAYEQECQQKGYSIIYSGYQAWNGPKGLRAIVNWLRCQYYIYREIQRNRPDIIHSHGTLLLPFVTFPAFFSGIKTKVHTLHSDPDSFNIRYVWWARFAFHLFGTYPICVTKGQSQKAIKRYGIKNYSVIRNGIDFKRFANINRLEVRKQLGIPENAVVIGSVGRLDKVKNYPFLIRVFAEYLKVNRDAFLLLVGDGIERENLEGLANYLGITQAVLFTGARNDVERMYYAMDIFMLTSFFESSSIVTIEAQIAGIKCVISNSIPEDVVVTNKVNRLSLDAPIPTWISALQDKLPHDKPNGKLDDFSMESTIITLKSLYTHLLQSKGNIK